MGRKLLKKGETPDQFQTELYDKITKIEAEVLERIQKLKGNTKSYLCEHFTISSPDCEPYDQNVNYYDKFWKRFLLNQIGKQNLLQFKDKLENFSKRLGKIQNLFGDWERQLQPIMKVKRRSTKIQDNDKQICSECGRSYRDEQTLLIHKKIKHGEVQPTEIMKQDNELDIYQQENEDD